MVWEWMVHSLRKDLLPDGGHYPGLDGEEVLGDILLPGISGLCEVEELAESSEHHREGQVKCLVVFPEWGDDVSADLLHLLHLGEELWIREVNDHD